MERQRGQATVEVALCLPLMLLLIGALIEVGMLAGDRATLAHAAREAARAAVVNPEPRAAEDAARRSQLQGLEVRVEPDRESRRVGDPLTVRLAYRPSGSVPIVRNALAGVVLRAQATMRIERP